jgi:hypothetical protein
VLRKAGISITSREQDRRFYSQMSRRSRSGWRLELNMRASAATFGTPRPWTHQRGARCGRVELDEGEVVLLAPAS